MVFDDDDDDDDKLWFHNRVFKKKNKLFCVFLCMFQFFLCGMGWGGVGQ